VTLPRYLTWLCALVFVLLLDVARASNAEEFFRPRDQLDLSNAAAAGSSSEMDAAAKRGAKVNFQGVGGMTAIIWALGHQSKEGVSWLLAHGADPNLVYAPSGNSSVTIAATMDDPWYLEQVLANGGNPNYQNPINKHTPLVDAMVPVSADNARALIAAGADLNVTDARGFTALSSAAATWRYEVVYDMLIAGADPTIKMGKNGHTILSTIRTSRVPAENPSYEWLVKVRDLLRQKGLDVDNGI
jgi:uncharacterized protein